MDYQFKRLWIKESSKDKKIWETFLMEAGIRPERIIDYTVGAFDGEHLIAVGSTAGSVLKCLAVDKKYTGGKVFNGLVSHLMSVVFDQSGETACYVYTKPSAEESFSHLGFKKIVQVEDQLVFMEKAVFGFSYYIEQLKTQKRNGGQIAGIVMNANPFTLGHFYLIETAARENEVVHLFILSEDASVFPAKDRLELVKTGVSGFKNVFIHQTGNYMVSSATFPSYFLDEQSDVAEVQAKLDATIFKEWIVPVLGITRRYVGEEPYSEVTNRYNAAMAEVFEGTVELAVLTRKQSDSEPISASRVRALLKEGAWEKVKSLVPKTTYNYLRSEKGKAVIATLKQRSEGK